MHRVILTALCNISFFSPYFYDPLLKHFQKAKAERVITEKQIDN